MSQRILLPLSSWNSLHQAERLQGRRLLIQSLHRNVGEQINSAFCAHFSECRAGQPETVLSIDDRCTRRSLAALSVNPALGDTPLQLRLYHRP